MLIFSDMNFLKMFPWANYPVIDTIFICNDLEKIMIICMLFCPEGGIGHFFHTWLHGGNLNLESFGSWVSIWVFTVVWFPGLWLVWPQNGFLQLYDILDFGLTESQYGLGLFWGGLKMVLLRGLVVRSGWREGSSCEKMEEAERVHHCRQAAATS